MSNDSSGKPWLRRRRGPVPPYEVYPERAAAVLWMFKASESGRSDNDIAATMPKRFDPWSSTGKWSRMQVKRVLLDRAVLGRPSAAALGGKLKGSVFPQIIDADLFNSVKAARATRPHGRKENGRANQFRDLVTCAYCDHEMQFRSAHKGFACKNEHCSEAGIIYPLSDLVASFDAFVGTAYRRGRALDEVDDRAAVDFEIHFLDEQRAAKEREIEELRRQIATIDGKSAELRKESKGLNKQRDGVTGADRITARVRGFLHRLRLAVLGNAPLMGEEEIMPEEASRRLFVAEFKDGSEAMITPSKTNPRRIVWQELGPVFTDATDVESQPAGGKACQ